MKFTEMDSPLGCLTLAASERGLAGVYFEDHRHFKGIVGWQEDNEHEVLILAQQQLAEFFAGTRTKFELPLDLSAGTGFQQQVWRALQTIPFGATQSYGALAKQIGNPQAVRAVGSANGRNPLSIVIPCHRVIASNGALTGYAGGLKNKQSLLKFEADKRQSLCLHIT